MNPRELRTVLLIHSIEETDRGGEVIPLADRADASRWVLRESGKLEAQPSAALSPHATADNRSRTLARTRIIDTVLTSCLHYACSGSLRAR